MVGDGVGAEVEVLYGGSVNPGKAAALFAEEEVDGALVGGASLEAASFWRIVAALVLTHATYQALQGLWLAPWLYDIAGMDRAAVARYLLITVVAYVAGSLVFGFSSDRLARAGVSRLTVFKAGLVVCVAAFCLLAAGVTSGLGVLLAVYGFATISGALAYPLMTSLFGPEMTLFFSLMEVAALALSVLIAANISVDGESNWLEGAQLLAVYLIVALGFYFIQPGGVPH